MGKYDNDEVEIDLMELFFELKKRIWIIAAALLVAAAAFGAYSKFVMVPQYTSTSMLYILSKETTLTSLADLQIGSQLTNDYKVLVTSRPVLNQVLENLNVDPNYLNYRQLRDKITIDNPTDTRIMNITVQDKNPIDAKAYADEIASTASTYIAEIMEMTPPKIVEEGEVPTIPISPSIKKNTLLGGVAGGILACGIIVLMTIMNDTIKDEEDVERYLELTVLAAIPVHSSESRGAKGAKEQPVNDNGKRKSRKKNQ